MIDAADEANLAELARAYAVEAGADPIVNTIIARSSIADTANDRAAARDVVMLAATGSAWRAIQLKDPLTRDIISRMNDAAQAHQPLTAADVLVATIVADIRRTMFPPPGAQELDSGSEASAAEQPVVPADIVALARAGKTVRAMSEYRARTGATMQEARAVITSV